MTLNFQRHLILQFDYWKISKMPEHNSNICSFFTPLSKF
jgi:hypothetical protein